MQRFFFIALLACATLAGTPLPKQGSLKPPSVISIGLLCSSLPPQGGVWVRATLLKRTGEDTFVIRDSTGQITLFLPTDTLIALDLTEGTEVLVYGTLDISPVKPEKNELYADQIYEASSPLH